MSAASERIMRPIFCGNFEYDARQSDLERLFRRYGKVDRVDMKSGFAFIYMEDERDADDAIRALDRKEFGRKGRRLRVEWTKQERGIRRPGSSKRSANTRPSKTLFVINFDPYNTRTRDLERHFDPYGKIVNVRIRRNFAFVQFESQEDATRALEATNMSKLTDRVISVEYAVRDDDDKKNGHSPRARSLEGGRDKGRSPSPYRRERGSPDYGRGRSPSPYKRDRASPDYGRRRSPSPYRRERASPDYGRGPSRSPYQREKGSPGNGRIPSRSPYKKERAGSDQGRAPSRSPYRRERATPDIRARSRSPYGGERASPDHRREPSGSPYGRERASPDHGRDPSISPYGRKRASPDQDNAPSGSPYQREKARVNHDLDASPNVRSGQEDSPISDGGDSPAHERYRSQSPTMRERSLSD